MALSAETDALIDELIVKVARTPRQDTKKLLQQKTRVHKILKNSKAGRADHLEVAKKLEGLQEKFQVLNNDALADALRFRLEELRQKRNYWIPEVLTLFLELSDRPATHSRLVHLTLLKAPESPAPLTWTEIYASDPEHEDIWDDIDYSADTSDDDASSTSSRISIPRIVPQRPKSPPEGFRIPEDLFLPTEGESLLTSIKDAHTWRNALTSVESTAKDHSLHLSELQTMREAIFMLRGLPTSLFWKLDDSIEVDRRFRLGHASSASFLALLHGFSELGTHINKLREFIKSPQSVQLVQKFQHEVDASILSFDMHLSSLQAQFAAQIDQPVVSLMQLFEDVQKQTRVLVDLAILAERLNDKSSEKALQCLDQLYDLVCLKQASGADDEFRQIARIFFSCFEIYMKPIQLWMETGQLDKTLGSFFVTDTGRRRDPKAIWSDWFALAEESGDLYAPKFLHPAAGKIFTTGKSMIFLHHLGISTEGLETTNSARILFEDVCPPETSSLLLSFGALLESAFDSLVDIKHQAVSTLLRKQLGEQCGLWLSLDALEYIYFGKDLCLSVAIDQRIFELIDKRKQSWNDRYLLTDLAQSTFSSLPCVDSTSLLIRSKHVHPREFENQCRSVKVLQTIFIDYVLPWPVANIITKYALRTYQRVSILLMQIRRAKFVLERNRLPRLPLQELDHGESKYDKLGYSIRHCLLWFVNILYSHLTERVISASVSEMRKSLAIAKDVDGMIAAHDSFIVHLEEQCLLSQHLAPIHQAVISLLDLCIHFSDIQSTRHGGIRSDQFNTSVRSSLGPQYGSVPTTPGRSRGRPEEPASEDSDASSSDGDLDDGNTTNISFLESPYRKRLVDARNKFEQLCSFVVSGLRGVGRVDGQVSWEALAEKLEWRKGRTGYI